MNKNYDIIYFTLFPWENAYSSVSLSFAKEFAKHNRIFYVNHPYSFKDFVNKRKEPIVKERKKDLLLNRMRYETVPGYSDRIIAAHPPMVAPINWMKDGMMYKQLLNYNNKVILKTIRKIIKDYQLKDFIYLNCFNPYFAGTLPADYGQILNIYQCIDDMTQEVYTARHGARLEDIAIKNADLTLVTSTELWNIKSKVSKDTHILNNAVDISIYENALTKKFERPEEIKEVKTKIIGYMGNINEARINYGLLKKIAETHHDKTLLIVGPLNSNDYIEHGLDKMPNVIFTGGKNIRDLPPYVQNMDVALIPFHCNTLTKSIYPLKINEYLAVGRPVVATNFSEDIRSFSDHIYIAENETQFIKLIDQAINENTPEKQQARLKVAESNTWSARVKEFWTIVNKHLDQPQKAFNKEAV